MPAEWYNYPEAVSILNGLSPSNIHIEEYPDPVNGRVFVWAIEESLDKRLEVLRHRAVDNNVGYKISEATDFTKEDAWFDEYERQASLNDRLMLKYGDPNVLLGYNVQSANSLWKKDVNVVHNFLAKAKEVKELEDFLRKQGRL